MKTYFHGEVVCSKIKCIPDGCNRVFSKDGLYILADSETTGNHHVLNAEDGVELFERDGVLYLKNTVPARVSCILKERHDEIKLESGIWEIDKAQEFDYFKMRSRNVAD